MLPIYHHVLAIATHRSVPAQTLQTLSRPAVCRNLFVSTEPYHLFMCHWQYVHSDHIAWISDRRTIHANQPNMTAMPKLPIIDHRHFHVMCRLITDGTVHTEREQVQEARVGLLSSSVRRSLPRPQAAT